MGRLLAFLFLPFMLILSAKCTRIPRGGLNGQDVGVNIEWLTDAQLSELGEAEGQSARMEKLRTFFDVMEPGESKKMAAEKIVAECYNWVEEVAGKEGREELNRLHHSEHGKCKQKVAELLAQIEDGEKKAQIEAKLPFCEHVWYSQHNMEANGESANANDGDEWGEQEGGNGHGHEHHHHHHRRRWAHRHPRDHFEEDDGEHEHHNLEDYLQSHLSWLSPEQKKELRGMKGQGKEAIQAKTMEFFEASSGEQRTKAIRQLQSGCRELIRRVFGGENAAELRRMRERGAGVEEMEAKIKTMTEALEDEGKKEKVREFGPACRKIFAMNVAIGRRRRDHHEGGHGPEGHEAHHGGHTLEDYFKTHLSWLTDAQREELKGMKGEGKTRAEMQQKVMEWFGQMEGDEKEKAGELLKGGCRELIKALLGEEKAQEVQKMKEAGTAPEKIGTKVDEWIGQLEEGRKKQMAIEYAPTCRRLFGVPSTNSGVSRMRRSHRHRHRYEDYRQREEDANEEDEVQLDENNFNDNNDDDGIGGQANDDHHLDRHRTWLSGKQKKMLRGMRERGHASHELHDKIHQFYEVSPDEVKATAKGILQKGCEAILQRVFGDYKAEEIIQAKEEGASNAEIDEKIDEALAQIRSPAKREEAARFAMTCRRIFTMIERGRREVAPAEKTLEELFKSYLSWLTPTQKDELNGMKEAGKGRSEMHQKVMEWFGQLEGEEKAKALEKLRDGCRELLISVIGKENADELKRMKEDGIGETELEAKAQEFIGTIGDETKKQKAKDFGPTCKRIFLAN